MITTTGAEWNRFCGDESAFPDGVFLEDVKVAVDGNVVTDGLRGVPGAATISIMDGSVCFPDGTDELLVSYFDSWHRRHDSRVKRQCWLKRLFNWNFK